MERMAIKGIRIGQLYNLPQMHDGDAVADEAHDAQVVGDEQIGQRPLALEPEEQVEHLRADGDIQRGDGLVGDDELRLHDQGACDADALALAAGKLVREAAGKLRQQADGGQRQAASLLMATIAQPKLLLLDEHTAALDPGAAEKVMQLTETIVQRDHITTLMVTHDMDYALRVGSRTIMLDSGRIVMDLTGEERASMTSDALAELFYAKGKR